MTRLLSLTALPLAAFLLAGAGLIGSERVEFTGVEDFPVFALRAAVPLFLFFRATSLFLQSRLPLPLPWLGALSPSARLRARLRRARRS